MFSLMMRWLTADLRMMFRNGSERSPKDGDQLLCLQWTKGDMRGNELKRHHKVIIWVIKNFLRLEWVTMERMESPFLKVFKNKFCPSLLRVGCSSQLGVGGPARKFTPSVDIDLSSQMVFSPPPPLSLMGFLCFSLFIYKTKIYYFAVQFCGVWCMHTVM